MDSLAEYWSGYPIPSLGDLPNPGIEPMAPELQVDSLPAELPGKPHDQHYLTSLELHAFLFSEDYNHH